MQGQNDYDGDDLEEINFAPEQLRQDPFSNDLILETICKYLPVSDLKNARLLSRRWRRSATPHLVEKSVVELDGNIRVTDPVIRVDKFLQNFQSTPQSEIIFRNYRLLIWNIEPNEGMIWFWQKFGPTMKSLEVAWGRFNGIDMIRNVFFTWTPNLKKLILRGCSFWERSDLRGVGCSQCSMRTARTVSTDPDVRINYNLISLTFGGQGAPYFLPPITWNEILNAYPNLKELLLYNLTVANIVPVLDAMTDIRRNDPTKLAIEKLRIFKGDDVLDQIPNCVLTNLIDLKLPLIELVIDIGVVCDELLIARLIEQYSRILRNLTIYRGPFGTPFTNFPFEITFPKLRKLAMTDTVADTFDFIQNAPLLSNLSICRSFESEGPHEFTEMMFKSDYNLHSFGLNLRSLRIDYECTSGDVRKIVHWFPSVKSVRMHLCTEAFRLVCTDWPDLEELEVLGNRLDDEGITGIKIIREAGYMIFRNPVSILSLKRLKVFIMTNYGMPISLTDFSVRDGFMRLRSLTRLELSASYITNNALQTLASVPGLKTTILPM